MAWILAPAGGRPGHGAVVEEDFFKRRQEGGEIRSSVRFDPICAGAQIEGAFAIGLLNRSAEDDDRRAGMVRSGVNPGK